MKTKQQVIPAARVMTAVEGMEFRVMENNEPRLKMRSPHDVIPDYFPVAVIPCQSLRSARQRVKFERMAYEEKADAISSILSKMGFNVNNYEIADRVLALSGTVRLASIGIKEPPTQPTRSKRTTKGEKR